MVLPLVGSKRFLPVTLADSYSGHKLQVACETVDDILEVVGRVGDVVIERGMAMKVATPYTLNRPADHPERTKGVTVYLPRRATLEADTAAIVDSMAGYRLADARIPDGRFVGNGVSSRFEFASDPGRDVGPDEREALYRMAPANVAYHQAHPKVGSGQTPEIW